MKSSSSSRYAQLVQAGITLERLTQELGHGPELTNLPDFRTATVAARAALVAYTNPTVPHIVKIYDEFLPRLEIAEALIDLHNAPEPAGKERLPRQ